MSDIYDKTVRRLHGKVEMTFYEYTSDERATPALGKIQANSNGNFIGQTPSGIRKNALANLINADRKPEHKHVTLDGLSYPNSTVYPMPSASNETAAVPVWSFNACDENGVFAEHPAYVLNYPEVREVSRLLIVGDEMWKQFPVEYNVNLYVPEDYNASAKSSDSFRNADYNFVSFDPEEKQAIVSNINGFTCKKYTFKVTLQEGEEALKQCVMLEDMYPATRAELEIIKWSTPKTCAKIMLFSDDVKFVCLDNELKSMSVLEEKAEKVDELSYGITSNTCTVKVLNKDNRFIRMPDLLKLNRVVKPYVMEEEDGKWCSLGKFFSDSWEIASNSDFVTCKAYDVLYNLQKMNICYEMTKSLGTYYVDGSANNRNASAASVFEKIFRLINAQRKDSGIYGSDIAYNIDTRLKEVKFEYVCLGTDTAWNMLQTVANAAQCFIYVDRKGTVQIKQDDFNKDTTTDSGVMIIPSNSFSYNLPTMSHAIVNRITVPYIDKKITKITDDNIADEKKKNEFTIESKDFEFDEKKNVVLNLSLKNFYPVISAIKLCNSDFKAIKDLSSKEVIVSYDKIKVFLGEPAEGPQYVKIFYPKENTESYELISSQAVYDDKDSQKHNGVAEFELKCDKLIFGEKNAQAVADKILTKYCNGVPYIETEWRGSPMLDLGERLTSFSLKDPSEVKYECLSNDMSYDGGLKVKTKARKITAPKKITASE